MSSIFGTFGQNNNNNQQQQPQPQQGNAFGQPSAFGSTSDRPDFSELPPLGFGTFGQTQQQQQQQPPPQVNPMFGNLATPSSSATPGTGGFGAFTNAGSNNAFGSRPAFGSTATSTFGQPSAFSGNTGGGVFGTGFGSTNTGSPSAFGQPSQPQQSAFGSTTSNVFGKPAGFGSTALVPTSTSPVPSSGTANPPFQEVQERDPTSVNSNSVLRFQSITAMPEYRNASFEELRVQDYLQGRKVASSTSGFGSTATTSAFGQPSQPSTGLFGQQSTTSNTFGQQQPSTGFGGFGQTQQQQQPQQSAFGGFGQTQQQSQPAPSTGFGTFGQQTQQQPTSGFGAFGQQTQQPQSTSAFGTFGQQNKTPFGAFGGQATQTPNTFSAFGSNTNPTTSAFGQAPQPQQQQSAFGGFGQNNAQQQSSSFLKPSVFGSQPATSSVFGTSTNQQQQQPQSSIFGTSTATQQPTQTGLFGNTTTTQQSSPFGQSPQPPQQTSVFGSQPSGGLFGTTPQNQQQNQQASTTGGFNSLFSKPAGSSIFGNNTATQPSNTQNLQNPNPNNPLFSGGGGLFGNTNNNQPTAPSSGGSLFGSTNTSTGLWGAKPATSAPAFGSTGGLFGNTTQGTQQTQPPGAGLFGNATQQSPQPSGSLFGSSPFGNAAQQQPQQQQPTLTASIDQPLPANLPTLPPLAASLNFDKKKSNIFADIALRTSPRLSLHYKPPSPSSKTRSLNMSTNRWQIPSNSTPGGSPNKLFPLSQSKSLITPEAFASPGSLQLLNGARQSVKKLILDKHVEKDDILRLRPDAASDAKIRFNPALEAMARAKDNEPTTLLPAKGHPSNSVFVSSTEKTTLAASAKVASAPLDPQEGEYWCLPTVPDLQRLSYNELQAVKDFTVGRVGYGTVQFLEPVDLTTVPSIADIPGKIIAFEHMECTLYTDERLRPPPGEGLNVPARIKLDRCWALDKSTREPIKDPENLKYQQRSRKMQNQEGTEFVNFEKETGVWEFLVQEF